MLGWNKYQRKPDFDDEAIAMSVLIKSKTLDEVKH